MSAWWEDLRAAVVVFRALRRTPYGAVISIGERLRPAPERRRVSTWTRFL